MIDSRVVVSCWLVLAALSVGCSAKGVGGNGHPTIMGGNDAGAMPDSASDGASATDATTTSDGANTQTDAHVATTDAATTDGATTSDGAASDATSSDDGGGSPSDAATATDSGASDSAVTVDSGPPDLGPMNECVPSCGPTELCGDLGQGNGVDDNCNGMVDESCMCSAPGLTMPCFNGPPDRRNVGACSDGVETCTGTSWSGCQGSHGPTAETCNGLDDNCNGMVDEGLLDCSSNFVCPGTQSTTPLSTYELRGETIYGGAATNWHWTVGCPASVPAGLCPAPSSPTSRDTSVYFTASGGYRVAVSYTPAGGSATVGCAWTVYVAGTGLRVELNWDTLEAPHYTDVDLHLHHWTQNGTDSDFYNNDDCFYGNCTAPAYSGGVSTATWSELTSSPVTNCNTAPHGNGALWSSYGSCPNPRLDVDTNGGTSCDSSITDPTNSHFCAPENINVDVPSIGMPYRIMVNYYNSHGYSGTTLPTVNVYCGGALRGTFGVSPTVPLVNGGDDGPPNDNWMVADVVFSQGTCGVECTIYPIGTVSRGSFSIFTGGTLSFSPAWSCNYDAVHHTCH